MYCLKKADLLGTRNQYFSPKIHMLMTLGLFYPEKIQRYVYHMSAWNGMQDGNQRAGENAVKLSRFHPGWNGTLYFYR